MRRVLEATLIIFFLSAFMPGITATAQAGTATDAGAVSIIITETAAGALKVTAPELWWAAGELEGSVQGTMIHTMGNYLDIVLPPGVTFDRVPDVEVTDGDLEIGICKIINKNSTLRIPITAESNIASTITISNPSYSILNQPAVGDITAQVGGDYNQISDKPLENLKIGQIGNTVADFTVGDPAYRVNGTAIPVTSPAYIKNDRIYLAVRDIGTGLGIDPVNILWDETNQRVTMLKGDKTVQLTIGSTAMYVNGTAIEMDAAPEMGPDFRTMLPAAYIVQVFGAVASWDGINNTVTVK